MNKSIQSTLWLGSAIALTVFCGCNKPDNSPPTPGETPKSETSKPGDSSAAEKITAVANLNPTQGNDVRGKVTFTSEAGGVRIVADITGFKPGDHGFHVHEKGDCSSPDGKSAGDHFNPTAAPHGAPDAEKHHTGDMGNITADDSGKAHLDKVFSFLSLTGENSIIGRAFIVHGGKDDLTSQPAGNAGPRVACGVIEKQ